MSAKRCNFHVLAYNLIGLIASREDASASGSVIDIEFHNRESYRPIHFSDHYGFSLAALGSMGAAFASPATFDSPSTLHYLPFEAWAPRSEWTLQMDAGESILGKRRNRYRKVDILVLFRIGRLEKMCDCCIRLVFDSNLFLFRVANVFFFASRPPR
jgi:Minichromosome loss protein, Mcl1, middle region